MILTPCTLCQKPRHCIQRWYICTCRQLFTEPHPPRLVCPPPPDPSTLLPPAATGPGSTTGTALSLALLTTILAATASDKPPTAASAEVLPLFAPHPPLGGTPAALGVSMHTLVTGNFLGPMLRQETKALHWFVGEEAAVCDDMCVVMSCGACPNT